MLFWQTDRNDQCNDRANYVTLVCNLPHNPASCIEPFGNPWGVASPHPRCPAHSGETGRASHELFDPGAHFLTGKLVWGTGLIANIDDVVE
jgi:hypothetical protein